MRRKIIEFSLLWRKIFGKLDQSDEQELKGWLTDDPENQTYFNSLEAFQKNRPEISDQDHEAAWKKLQAKLNPSAPGGNVERIPLQYFYRAAAIFVIAAFSVVLWKYYSPLSTADSKAITIKPGKSAATLITYNGRTIHLGDSTVQPDINGIPAKVSSSSLTYYPGDTIAPQVEMNTLQVPRGGEFELTLADGTHVWLNAESTIKFPTSFAGPTRTVILTGEAYFEVAKDPNKPFEVIAQDQTISVLGTSFNVSTYPQDAEILTTLVEGTIKVSGQEGQSLVVHPGNQSVYNLGSGEITSRAVDTSTYTSWKNGLFIFDDEELGVILQRISRWYDVDIRYRNASQQQTRFTVHINKYQPITEILKLIEITNAVDFEIEDKTIIVQ
jgi:ferric-dicitrate binding protein FerR (iron transport regulator)